MDWPSRTAKQLMDQKRPEVAGVIAVAPGDTVLSALKLMREKDIGAVVVLDNDKLKGILTERDYARDVELEGLTAKDCLVHQIMTDRLLVYAMPGDSIERCRALMTEHRVRHLPIYDSGKVVGVLSIRDILEGIIAEEKEVIRELQTDRLLMTTDTGAY
jgi:CBS domain-containing protein